MHTVMLTLDTLKTMTLHQHVHICFLLQNALRTSFLSLITVMAAEMKNTNSVVMTMTIHTEVPYIHEIYIHQCGTNNEQNLQDTHKELLKHQQHRT